MQWSESIRIAASSELVYDAVHDQQTLMAWSAWPEATGFTCRVEGDGLSPGSQIVFADSEGEEQGRQTLVSADGEWVRNRMRNRGPRGRWIEPRVDFQVTSVSPNTTQVTLEFEVEPPVPRLLRPIANRWLQRSIRPLHVKDLEQLKSLVETRNTTQGSM